MMRFIPQNSKTILSLLTGLCLLLCFMVGCKEAPPPAKPAVVKKQIKPVPQQMTSEKETAPPAAEAKSTSVAPSLPDQKVVTEATKMDAEKATPSKTDETAAPKETGEQSDSEQLSLRSSLPDTSPLYDPTGRIDPFKPLFSENRGGSDSTGTKPERPLTPLEKIDLSQLQLVAILRLESGNRAMVEDATGKGYVLKPGTYIGTNSGKVTKILEDSVIVEEKTKDFLGKVTTNTRELKLQKPFGEE
jgi:type IV pilus assembly protein PilP